MMNKEIVIGIDATNIRGGGGSTHLIELINALKPVEIDIHKVIVWTGTVTSSSLPKKSWLKVITPKMLNMGLFPRAIWQAFFFICICKKLWL